MITLNMMAYGINTIVGTCRDEIDFYMNAYATQPDKRFGGGAGKVALLEHTKDCIEHEDAYFDAHPNAQVSENKRWREFLQDCVIYATLHSYLYGSPLPVMNDKTPIAQAIAAIQEQLGPQGELIMIDAEARDLH
jgi:hypothetical protein